MLGSELKIPARRSPQFLQTRPTVACFGAITSQQYLLEALLNQPLAKRTDRLHFPSFEVEPGTRIVRCN